ncbi:MAG: NADH-quinone oxidoreductase subunit A [Armatimonadetes bacterium]|nr:NADH-quinone oxidoreductase subunit A [Armatimonadota bacterium]
MPTWIAVVLLVVLALLFTVGSFVGTMAFKPRRHGEVKGQPYESGVKPTGDARGRQVVRFYLVAMLFLVFDLELAFLYPWALYFNAVSDRLFLFVEIVVFLGILLVGYFYAWRKGALDWNK